ncbi:MAG TPA: biotin--[acetyl-CoA-carboxylase] ligase [Gemmatimonadales bacterium]|nr:biotin--[acetyl-CoA-carboxylase] ligase [Gemmatimonadales bacterium]
MSQRPGTGAPAIHRFDAVPSTMDRLHDLAESGAPAGTVVVAAEQTAGRGSRGRRWQSPPGGLWMSILLRPARDGTELLSLRAGLAIAEALERSDSGLGIGIKWPNDLMWRDRKIGGLLCEARWTGSAPAWTAVGVGLNLRNPVPQALRDTAAALGEHLPALTPEMALDLVLPGLRSLAGGAPRLDDRERHALARRDWLRGRRLLEPVAGVAAGIGDDGALLVRRPGGGLAEVRAGTVRLAGDPVSP